MASRTRYACILRRIHASAGCAERTERALRGTSVADTLAMTEIRTTRFGNVEAARIPRIQFPLGLPGMPSEREFVLLRHDEKSVVLWLQSTMSPGFALPVVAAHQLDPAPAGLPLGELAARAGLPDELDEIAVLVVTSFGSDWSPTVNPIAPILIGTASLRGAQVLCPRPGLGVREKLTLASPSDRAMSPAA